MSFANPIAFARLVAQSERSRVGGVCQAPVRRTSASARLRGPIYASRRDLQQPSARYRKRSDPLSLEGLSSWRPNQDDDLVRRRIHPAFLITCAAGWTSAHPVLRFSGKSLSERKTGAVPALARHVGTKRAGQLVAGGEGLPRPLRTTYRPVASPVSALQGRSHAGGCDLAAVAL